MVYHFQTLVFLGSLQFSILCEQIVLHSITCFRLISFEFFFQQSNVLVGFIFLHISLGFVLEDKFQNMLSF